MPTSKNQVQTPNPSNLYKHTSLTLPHQSAQLPTIEIFSNHFSWFQPLTILQKNEQLYQSKQGKHAHVHYLCTHKDLDQGQEFYMRSLEDCAGKVDHGGDGVSGYTASQVPHVSRSFSVNSSSSSNDQDVRQLLRTSTSNRTNSVEKDNKNKSTSNSDMHRRPIAQPIVRQPNNTMNGMGVRCYSVGLKMGRIDEETACSFWGDEVNVKTDLYPRSKSYAVK